MVWIVLAAAALAIILVGLLATGIIVGHTGSWPPPPSGFWTRFVGAAALTLLSVSIRSLRFIFLLRRAETRIPIRDAYIGYFAGLSLLVVPFLIGEIAVRATVLQMRGRVPVTTTATVNIWERLLDLLALGVIAAVASLGVGQERWWHLALAGLTLAMLVPAVRQAVAAVIASGVTAVARSFDDAPKPPLDRLTQTRTWLTASGVSLVAWVLPGLGLWLLAGAWGPSVDVRTAEQAFASSSSFSGVSLAPAGVLVAGSRMLSVLEGHGLDPVQVVMTVFAVRLATVGVSMAMGMLFVAVHLRGARLDSAAHFDEIADAYDVQIPESRRHALLDLKTGLMRDVINQRGGGRRGLDVGCGQGAYVARMCELGFDVSGIDASSGQVLLAGRNVGDPDRVRVGSVLSIPAADASFDFLYIINVLHHLGSIEEQQRAFAELFRVLRPGGLLFVHEINTRNVLFRFYMGYVFPSLNCIDEGIERWLLAHRLDRYTNASVVQVQYFTFLPDFIPQPIARLLRPLERALERSSLAPYSAHYMAVLQKDFPEGSDTCLTPVQELTRVDGDA